MRSLAASLGLLVVLPACTAPNPAYHATQGLDSSSGDPPSSTSPDTDSASSAATGEPTGSGTSNGGSGPTSNTTPATTADTTADTALTGLTTQTSQTVTTDGSDSDVSTATTDPDSTSTTDGPDSTSTGNSGDSMPKLDLPGGQVCSLVDSPDLTVKVQHSQQPQDCTASLSLYGVFESKPDASSLKFRRCADTNQCFAGNAQCIANETVTIQIAGPDVPKFSAGNCIHISYLGAGSAEPNTCDTRVLRLAKTGPQIFNTTVFASGVQVPSTGELDPPWPDSLGFKVGSELVEACGGQQVCGQDTGSYQLVGTFSGAQHEVPMGQQAATKIPLLDKNNTKIGDVHGVFRNIRSYAYPVEWCEFQWTWLADDYKP